MLEGQHVDHAGPLLESSATVLVQVNFIGRLFEAVAKRRHIRIHTGISESDDREQAKGDCSEDRFHLISPRFQVTSLHVRVYSRVFVRVRGNARSLLGTNVVNSPAPTREISTLLEMGRRQPEVGFWPVPPLASTAGKVRLCG